MWKVLEIRIKQTTAMDSDKTKGKNRKGLQDEIIKIFTAYQRFLKEKPLLTKSISSGVIAGFGDIIAQKIVLKDSSPISLRQTGAFTLLGLLYSGPLSHYFYAWLDRVIPKNVPYYAVKRIIADRFIIAPPYLLAFFYLLGLLEGHGHAVSVEKIKQNFWTALKMNWKIWTIFQYVNINYVPIQFRVLFASFIAFIWTIYLAVQRRTAP